MPACPFQPRASSSRKRRTRSGSWRSRCSRTSSSPKASSLRRLRRYARRVLGDRVATQSPSSRALVNVGRWNSWRTHQRRPRSSSRCLSSSHACESSSICPQQAIDNADRSSQSQTAAATRLASDDPSGPFFSSNGQSVGFSTATELKKVSISSGIVQTICSVDGGQGASWSPDDTIILGSTFRALFRVSANGGEPEPLIQKREIAHAWPRVLPGGKSVMFTSVSGRGSDAYSIEVLNLETKERKVLQQGGSDGRYVPTGHLVYSDDGTLFAAPFDLREMEVTGSASPL